MNTQRIYYPGLDIIKFILAIFIIAGHTNLGEEFKTIYPLLGILESMAVPCFFSISAFLFFNKLDSTDNQQLVFSHSIKRLLLIFLLWYVIMLPMTYHTFFKIATVKEIIYAIFFTCTFSGYWFLKALIINTIILYYFRKSKSLIFISISALIIHLFWFYNYKYTFISLPISPYYSFYYHTIYFSIGGLLARYLKESNSIPKRNLILGLFITYTIAILYPSFDFIYKLLFPVFIIILFLQIHLNINPLYKYLRNISILLYVIHFILIWGYKLVCTYCLEKHSITFLFFTNSITRFFIVLITAFSISSLILYLEKKPLLSFLRKLH